MILIINNRKQFKIIIKIGNKLMKYFLMSRFLIKEVLYYKFCFTSIKNWALDCHFDNSSIKARVSPFNFIPLFFDITCLRMQHGPTGTLKKFTPIRVNKCDLLHALSTILKRDFALQDAIQYIHNEVINTCQKCEEIKSFFIQ